jgi:cell division protein FtsB
MIGIVVILLGLAAAGVLADAAVENASAAGTHTVALFGQTVHPSTVQLAVGGAILGALAVILVGTGVAVLRAVRRRHRAPGPDRRELERRVDQLAARSRLLESQNASLNQENEALRQRAEELEGESPPPSGRPEEFGPPARQVSKTALILVPPPPAPPGENVPRQQAGGGISF